MPSPLPPPSPLPLHEATARLLTSVLTPPSPPSSSSRARRHRIEVHPPPGGLLPWLRAQTTPQALLYRCRNASFEVAGLRFAHHATGRVFSSAAHAALAALLDPASPDMRFYGAARFDASASAPAPSPASARADPLWARYDGYTFVLPAVELLREGARVFLAANVLPGPRGGEPAADTLRALVAPAYRRAPPQTPAVARPLSVENLTSFRAWDAAMAKILARLRSGAYDKIVLARRKRFNFAEAAPPDVLAVVAALEAPPKAAAAAALAQQTQPACPGEAGGNAQGGAGEAASLSSSSSDGLVLETVTSRGSYLFCLQLEAGHAFVGCTPERLFRVDGNRLLTEALAGTVRRDDAAQDDARVAELCCTKNMEEHRYVVDYIQDRLADAGLAVRTSGPRVVRLPRLMHLATDFTGCFANNGDGSSLVSGKGQPGGDISGLTHRLLESMHPTPAVGGIPVEKTMADLPALENFDRGFFAGPLGWFSNESSDFCVAIRSALISGNVVTAYAGCGIVNGSESRSEWDESELKMSAFTDMFGAPGTPAPAVSDDSAGSDCSVSEDAGSVDGCTDAATGMNGHARHTYGHTKQRVDGGVGTVPCSSEAFAQSPIAEDEAGDSCDVVFDPRRIAALPNINTVWGNLTVEELCRCGVDRFFVCPGSRSAPLAVAVTRSRRAHLTVVHDERGAAFMALGYARATGRAAAVVTSSGTAVANLLPAVVEAANDNVPLILLTADRPPELRDIGANQAIDQVKIFGCYTRWFKDVPCPTPDVPIRNLLCDIDHAVFKSGSAVGSGADVSADDSGPVHLNLMFREKLAPDEQAWDRCCLSGLPQSWTHGTAPLTSYTCPQVAPIIPAFLTGGVGNTLFLSRSQREICSLLVSCQNVLVVLGGGAGGAHDLDDRLAIARLAETRQWPVIADIASGMRLERHCSTLIPYGDLVFASPAAREGCNVQAVVQFGERVTSKRVAAALSGVARPEIFVVVTPSSARCDPSLTASHRFVGSASSFALDVLTWAQANPSSRPSNGICDSSTTVQIAPGKRKGSGNRSLLETLAVASEAVDGFLSEKALQYEKSAIPEPFLARMVSESLLPGSALFVGNSMPIRDFDSYASCGPVSANWQDQIVVDANRGASGIDGVLSSGIGYAHGSGRRTVVVIGDMSFLHDLNALHALRPASDGGAGCPSVTVIVVNNGGGGIFSMLPIARHTDVFSPVFDTPHGVSFAGVADAFSMQYSCVKSVQALRELLVEPVYGRHRLIEAFVSPDHEAEAGFRRNLVSDIAGHVSEALTSAGGGTYL